MIKNMLYELALAFALLYNYHMTTATVAITMNRIWFTVRAVKSGEYLVTTFH